MNELMTFAPLIGCDIYHGNMPFSRYFGNFQIHKATEGRTFVDSDFVLWCNERPECSLNGAYHFMSTSDPRSQAEHFLSTVALGKRPMVLILDLEGKALDGAIKDPKPVIEWLEIVTDATHRRPWLYTNTYGTTKLDQRILSYPLWIASYNKKYPVISDRVVNKNDAWLCWQFTSTPWDMDIFNGTAADWKTWEAVL